MADLLVLEPSAVRFVFERADGCSGNGYACERCGCLWVDHIAPGCQCPTVPGSRAVDELCALWIDEAPRFGAVAAAFPESLRKRRFVAGFWAPEVLLFGWWYLGLGMGRHHGQRGGVLCGNTRAGLDIGFSGAIEIAGAPCHPGCLPSRKHLPFWSPELPEVMESTRHPSSKRTYFAPCGPGDDEKPWRPVRRMALALLLLCLALPAGAQTLFGVVSKVSDGDTLTVGKTRIRLFGIDAPEGRQECRLPSGPAYRCGESAQMVLEALAPVGSSISCRVQDVDRYGRLVAVCSSAIRAESDLSAEMVLAGWAVAHRKYSTRYVAVELLARTARRGLWGGTFVQPEEWRKGVRR